MRQLVQLQLVLSRWPRSSAGLGFFAAVAVLAGAHLAPADRLPLGPVEELRQVLRADKEGVRLDVGRRFREAELKKRVAAIQSLGDLSQALLLPEWRDASEVVNPALRKIDELARRQLAERFVSEVRRVLGKGDPTSRAAAAGQIGRAHV